MDAFGIDVENQEVSEAGGQMRLRSLHQQRAVNTCGHVQGRHSDQLQEGNLTLKTRAQAKLLQVSGGVTRGRGTVPWILMSAMLQLWSHTSTLKAPSVIITLKSMTSLSAGGAAAADRKQIKGQSLEGQGVGSYLSVFHTDRIWPTPPCCRPASA